MVASCVNAFKKGDVMDEHIVSLVKNKAAQLRWLSIAATTAAGSGHPTSCLSAADIVSTLFFHTMSYDPADHTNPNNDRFILSKGHAAPLLYAAWQQAGQYTQQELMSLRQLGSPFEGHPSHSFKQAEAATGSLGCGLSIGVGIALSAVQDKRDVYTYVLMGDSEVSEGAVWEAAALGSYHKLNRLVGIVDMNRLGQTGQTMHGYDAGGLAQKFEAFGWYVLVVDGHNVSALLNVFAQAKESSLPVMVIAETVKGYGLDGIANKNGFHGTALDQEAAEQTKKQFVSAGTNFVAQWVPRIPPTTPGVPAAQQGAIPSLGYQVGQKVAVRQACGHALAVLGTQLPQLVVLDAEVKNSTYSYLFEEQIPERFVQCFIAEQAMVGVATGFASRKKTPFCATFGAFFTRAFDQIRMAAIGKLPLRLIGTHAGVSIGHDGPSQMALEDIAMMRTVPDSVVLYPSDAVSAVALVTQMANHEGGISYLRATRGATPVLYTEDDQFSIGGCMVLKQSHNDVACVIGAGVTVHEALAAYEQLHMEGISIAVIDLYSIKPLDSKTVRSVVRAAGGRAIVVEDHYQAGGIGQAVQSAVPECQMCHLSVTRLPGSGTPHEQRAVMGIDAAAIVAAVQRA